MMRTQLTEKQFLARCKTAWKMGLCTPDRLALLERWLDAVMRLEGGQLHYVAEFLSDESKRTQHFWSGRTLANDANGYALIQLAAVLNHPCQKCGEDIEAWHTRMAFCVHK